MLRLEYLLAVPTLDVQGIVYYMCFLLEITRGFHDVCQQSFSKQGVKKEPGVLCPTVGFFLCMKEEVKVYKPSVCRRVCFLLVTAVLVDRSTNATCHSRMLLMKRYSV